MAAEAAFLRITQNGASGWNGLVCGGDLRRSARAATSHAVDAITPQRVHREIGIFAAYRPGKHILTSLHCLIL
jgi:hypothetical protein